MEKFAEERLNELADLKKMAEESGDSHLAEYYDERMEILKEASDKEKL